MNKKTDFGEINKASVVFYLLILTGLFYFFYKIHPLYIFDTDDWKNMAFGRRLYPSLLQYNPIKVFPETAMPIVSLIGVKIFYPLTNDYINSLCIGYSIFYSFVIVCFLFTLEQTIIYIKSKVKISYNHSLFYTFKNNFDTKFLVSIFVILLFILGRNKRHLFYAGNITCIFNYSIPALLNISLVLFLLYRNSKKQLLVFNNDIGNGFFIILIYLSVFSNLFQNIVLCAYISIKVALNFLNTFILKSNEYKTKKLCILNLLYDNYQYIVYLLVWGGACLFEANGMRAKQIGNSVLSINETINSLNNFIFQVIPSSNIVRIIPLFFILIFANIVLLYKYIIRKVRFEDIKFLQFQLYFLSIAVVIILFYILITIKTGLGYQFQESVTICWMIWILLSCFTSIIYLTSMFYKIINLVLPIYFISCLVYLCIETPPYDDFNISSVNTQNVKHFGNYIVEKAIDADKNRSGELILNVPKFETNDNWPFATYANSGISNVLYDQGITLKKVNVIIFPDPKIKIKDIE